MSIISVCNAPTGSVAFNTDTLRSRSSRVTVRRRRFTRRGWFVGVALMLCGLVPGWADAAPSKLLNTLMTTLEGTALRLSDLHGKLVLVNFWAVWCPPCVAEIPILMRFQEAYADRDVVVVGINYRDRVSLDRLKKFKKDRNISYPVVYADSEQLDALANALGGVYGLPVTKLLDRTGRVVVSHTGGVTEQMLHDMLKPHLDTTVEKISAEAAP